MAAQSKDCAAYDTGRQRGGGCASALMLNDIYIHVAHLQLSNADFTKLCYFGLMTHNGHSNIQSRPAKNSFILAKNPSFSGLPFAWPLASASNSSSNSR